MNITKRAKQLQHCDTCKWNRLEKIFLWETMVKYNCTVSDNTFKLSGSSVRPAYPGFIVTKTAQDTFSDISTPSNRNRSTCKQEKKNIRTATRSEMEFWPLTLWEHNWAPLSHLTLPKQSCGGQIYDLTFCKSPAASPVAIAKDLSTTHECGVNGRPAGLQARVHHLWQS